VRARSGPTEIGPLGRDLRRWLGSLAVAVLLVSGCTSATSDTKTTPTPTATTQAATATPDPGTTQDWAIYGFDAAHSGNNAHETTITQATVGGLHRVWHVKLPDIADSAPILVHGLKFPDGSTRDVLYLTTRLGRLVAIDAASGKTLWSKQHGGPNYTTSSPVIDAAREYVYSYGLAGTLHKHRATTGEEVQGNGWPVRVTYMPQSEKASSPLAYANGRVYVATAGYPGDRPPYQGHVVIVDAKSGGSRAFNSLCSNLGHVLKVGECASNQSGIWGRSGAVIDPINGNVYVVTGNGDFNGRTNWGDSVIQLSPDGRHVVDSYTPANESELDVTDADLGSTSPALLPRVEGSTTPYLLVQGGKDSRLLLINRQNMSGKRGPGHLGGELQIGKSPCGVYNEPAVWTDPATKTVWVFVVGRCGTYAYRVVTDSGGKTQLQKSWQIGVGAYGTSPVVAGDILFIAKEKYVTALDPTTGKNLWSTVRQSAGGAIGGMHWQGVIVVNGRLYAPDSAGYLNAYGL
jgi:hypothetical protein